MKAKFEKLELRVLYVEDEDVVRTTIYEMLKRRITEVYVASDGREGLEMYHKHDPEIVITDIRMPHMDGLEMIRNIKQSKPDIQIIITSAHSESEYFLSAIDIGVDKFVLKPVNNRELFALVSKVYEQLNLRQKAAEEAARRQVAERNLRESQEQLSALFENVVVGMGILDYDLRIIFSNQALAGMFDEEEYSVLSHSFNEYFPADSYAISRLRNLAGIYLEGIKPNFRSEEEIVLDNGKRFWAEISVSMILSSEKIINKFIVVINNVNDRVESQRERDLLYNSLIAELETAASVQSYFLPDWLCVEDKLLFSNNYTPSTNVGGDLFDLIKLKDGRYVVYIGDISGHGVQSALMMTAVKATIKMLVDNVSTHLHPSLIVNQLNLLLSRDVFQSNYLTLLLGVVDVNKKEFIYFNAGHPPIISYNKTSREVKIIESSGAIPIGWIADYEYDKEEEDILLLDDYTSYFFYTDGIFECENKEHEELGIRGIKEMLTRCTSDNSTVMLPYVLKQKIEEDGYDISSDDFTILSLNLRRDQNDKIRYYIINPMKDSSGDVGKHCEEFLKAKDVECLSFATELLVNEFLNKTLEHITEKGKESVIVIRLRVYDDHLEITFWDKGEDWVLPETVAEIDFDKDLDNEANCLYIINQLSDKMVRNRLVEVNETKFYLFYEREDRK
ncbi:MAG: response regulator [Candidatus Cloacimonetes bacterium]|nr:response regulator [Candidatus Cloacimonadota bacterium]